MGVHCASVLYRVWTNFVLANCFASRSFALQTIGSLPSPFERDVPRGLLVMVHLLREARRLNAPPYFNWMVTPPTAADTSAPTFGPLSCKITPLAFCS